jgi:hypothetical protein
MLFEFFPDHGSQRIPSHGRYQRRLPAQLSKRNRSIRGRPAYEDFLAARRDRCVGRGKLIDAVYDVNRRQSHKNTAHHGFAAPREDV